MCDECEYKHEDDGLIIDGVAFDKHGNPRLPKKKNRKK